MENRGADGFTALAPVFAAGDIQALLSDFHILVFLSTCGVLDQETLDLVAAIFTKSAGVQVLMGHDGWETCVAIFRESLGASSSLPASSSTSVEWACRHCTFVNHKAGNCEMCGLPSS